MNVSFWLALLYFAVVVLLFCLIIRHVIRQTMQQDALRTKKLFQKTQRGLAHAKKLEAAMRKASAPNCKLPEALQILREAGLRVENRDGDDRSPRIVIPYEFWLVDDERLLAKTLLSLIAESRGTDMEKFYYIKLAKIMLVDVHNTSFAMAVASVMICMDAGAKWWFPRAFRAYRSGKNNRRTLS